MRSDIREVLYHDDRESPPQRVTAAQFEGTYDLSPLTARNAGVRYLERTVASLRADGISVIAFLTPTNHPLLHEYIDSGAVRSERRFPRRLRSAAARAYSTWTALSRRTSSSTTIT